MNIFNAVGLQGQAGNPAVLNPRLEIKLGSYTRLIELAGAGAGVTACTSKEVHNRVVVDKSCAGAPEKNGL